MFPYTVSARNANKLELARVRLRSMQPKLDSLGHIVSTKDSQITILPSQLSPDHQMSPAVRRTPLKRDNVASYTPLRHPLVSRTRQVFAPIVDQERTQQIQRRRGVRLEEWRAHCNEAADVASRRHRAQYRKTSSSTKPEVQNLQRHQRRTKQRLQITSRANVNFGHWFLRYTRVYGL